VPDDPSPADLDTLWRNAQECLRGSVPESTFRLWLEPLKAVGADVDTLYLEAPEGIRAWAERRYSGLISQALEAGGTGLTRISFAAPRDAAGLTSPGPELNPSYTFDRFVIGPGNRLAHGAALAVAEAPSEAYNPLFLHGPPGLGKTHLLAAIANYLHDNAPGLSLRYTTAESFTNEFVGALKSTGADAFKARYRDIDVLLIDDVQFLEGKPATEEEFFHTFNALYESGSQLVLSADRIPSELSTLASRLRDRFEWGLTVPVEPPDLATRLVFLGNLASEQTEQLPPDALRALASKASANLRVLKGALTRVVALSSLTASAVTPDSVEQAVPSDEISPPPPEHPEPRQVQEAVAARVGLSVDDILSPTRTAPVARARQLAMYLTRALTDLSLPQIAEAFNRRDHTTVMHAIRRVESGALEDASISRAVEELTTQLQSGTGMDRDRTD